MSARPLYTGGMRSLSPLLVFLCSLVAGSLLLGPGAQAQDDGPSKEQLEAAVARIEAALEDGKLEGAVRGNALRAETGLVHPLVIAAIAKGLGEREPLVIDAAIECLGQMRHADALEALTKWGKRARKALEKDRERMVGWIKAVGRHQDPDTLDLLAKDAFDQDARDVLAARIYAIANVHAKESVEVLMDLLTSTDARKVNQNFGALRPALMRLTAVDQGNDPMAWSKWWRSEKRTFEVPREPAVLPREDQARWDRFWGNEVRYERGQRRSRRGQDPEDDK